MATSAAGGGLMSDEIAIPTPRNVTEALRFAWAVLKVAEGEDGYGVDVDLSEEDKKLCAVMRASFKSSAPTKVQIKAGPGPGRSKYVTIEGDDLDSVTAYLTPEGAKVIANALLSGDP